jgi:undecaprenyl-diphosphatase
MTLFQSFILGVVEGITEFLPISSTGHLILTSWLLGLSRTEFQKSFEIAIQLGAIGAVIVLYWRRFLDIEMLKKIAIAFLPTGIIGLALYRVVKTYLLGSEEIVIWALGLGGVALIVFELLHREEKNAVQEVTAIPYSKAFLVGLFQSISIIPGVSRAGATILGGLFVGLTRPVIVEFSFLLAVPTMLAATGYDLLKNASAFSSEDTLNLAVGFVTSFIIALISIKWLIGYVQTRNFIPFGIYRILVAVVLGFVLYGSLLRS